MFVWHIGAQWLIRLLPAAGILALGTVGTAAFAQASANDIPARSLVSSGNITRIQRVFAKARRGETVTVAVIGGSITAGAAATKAEYVYGNRIAQWWRTQFPGAKIEFVNAGIGATGSNYGALRAKRDLLGRKPDFVVVEYAVNDGNDRSFAETLEGLTRQILSQRQKPAVVLLFMMNDHGGNAQEWLSKVGAHYELPMISYRDALWPEIEAGRMEKSVVFADEVHPNDRGHEYAAQFVTNYLETVLNATPKSKRLPALKKLPAPLISDLFQWTALYEAPDITPILNRGWTLDTAGKCWKTDKQGSIMEFEVEGRLLLTLSFRIKGPMGRARIQVDDQPPVTVDAWFSAAWGGYTTTDVAARDLKPGTHHLRIEIVDKSPESSGYEYKLFAIGAAGAAVNGK